MQSAGVRPRLKNRARGGYNGSLWEPHTGASSFQLPDWLSWLESLCSFLRNNVASTGWIQGRAEVETQPRSWKPPKPQPRSWRSPSLLPLSHTGSAWTPSLSFSLSLFPQVGLQERLNHQGFYVFSPHQALLKTLLYLAAFSRPLLPL